MTNIFYIHNFHCIGGTETFLYYMAKKYKDWDVTVYYKTGDTKQIERLRKYVRVKKYNGEHIKCKKAIFNYVTDIIDNVEAEEYIQVIHTDFYEQKLIFRREPKIDKYIGVTQIVCDSMKQHFGIDCELCYNPVEVDTPKRVLKLVSATRLSRRKTEKIE